MARNWITGLLHNFIGLACFGFVFRLARRPSDFPWLALVAIIGSGAEWASTRPSPRTRRAFAWLHTGLALCLLALALSAPVRLALWHALGGVCRSGPVWALAAGGWAVLAGVAWWMTHALRRWERRAAPKDTREMS